MIIHREGHLIILITTLGLGLINALCAGYIPVLQPWLGIVSLVFFGLIVQFFRNPPRKIAQKNEGWIYAPADGQVVVIEETEEPEYFKEKKLQVSIFMSPLNVHVNRAAIGGTVQYTKYHPGKYLVAWHPKSSTENERTTVVIKNAKTEILLRQIAGAVARRIRYYVKEGQILEQGQEYGFIKFGSRVDLFLPLDAKVKVSIGQKVKGNVDVIATL
ncbi:phosphatidylserine decarboxylase family protein [Haliscomenobacter hydrossis]|uniref:Phosphatidylserine decarboxylase proenzyme n=1 Tax=Haliscomenobacter hydrossis (strain ATCC 27775 / DSM 1100 / LMG 10767 / O) TaxID=760192 RepID=F4KTH9_HALH1|nr:phosphatidylserine decarboxylase family protein [Haliscomenobacter hydrossis]AEE52393.1 Phosphatidylserine decarboxylase proenzyme [Haliscomenobacter hydrossis DSM 1100]